MNRLLYAHQQGSLSFPGRSRLQATFLSLQNVQARTVFFGDEFGGGGMNGVGIGLKLLARVLLEHGPWVRRAGFQPFEVGFGMELGGGLDWFLPWSASIMYPVSVRFTVPKAVLEVEFGTGYGWADHVVARVCPWYGSSGPWW